MSIALQIRVNELEHRCLKLEEMLQEAIEHMPKNGSDTAAPLEIRIRNLENNYKMLVARSGKGGN